MGAMSLSAAAVVLFGCGAGVRQSCRTDAEQTSSPTETNAVVEDERQQLSTPDELYKKAIRDAAVTEPDEVHSLKLPKGDPTTVVTWVDNRYLSSYPAGGQATLSWGDVWVTSVPEVQEKCREFPKAEQTLRLQQLLGLPPKNENRSFVVLEVRTEDLFRPCISPDIQSTQCEVSGSVTDEAHALFFAGQTAISYTIPNGYPWTRLGYTFDWNPDTPDYGASEYVIKKGTVVTVKEILTTADYCR